MRKLNKKEVGMTGKELIEWIQENHAEDYTIKVIRDWIFCDINKADLQYQIDHDRKQLLL